MERDACLQSLLLHILLELGKELLLQVPLAEFPWGGTLHFWSPSSTISHSSLKTDPSPQVPQWGWYRERHLSPHPSSSHPLIIHLSLRVSGKGARSMFPQQGSYGERYSVSRASDLFIHLCLSEST